MTMNNDEARVILALAAEADDAFLWDRLKLERLNNARITKRPPFSSDSFDRTISITCVDSLHSCAFCFKLIIS
jgi:hypothetical protein